MNSRRVFPAIAVFSLLFLILPAWTSAAVQSTDAQSITDVLFETAADKGVAAAIEQYRCLKAEQPGHDYFSNENALNSLGYRLLRDDRIDDAIEIFKLNIEMFPGAWNPIDSLAEAYLTKAYKTDPVDAEYKRLAIEYYDKAIAADPKGNYNSKTMFNKIYIMDNYSKYEHMVPMRDGVKLYTQVYMPSDDSKSYPVMLQRTPYRVYPLGTDKNSYNSVLGPAAPYAKDGFIFVYQDVRGKNKSEGEESQMRPLEPPDGGIDESTDTWDTIEWLLAEYPNNNGRVGMWGISYPGTYAAMALVNAHPALKAVSPQAPPADWFMGDDWHHNGAFFWFQCANWFAGNFYNKPEPYEFFLKVGPVSNIDTLYFKGRASFWSEMMEHGSYDDFWKARNTLPHFKNIGPDVAILTVGGWYDAENLYGALKTYQAIEKLSPEANNKLIMGAWYHGGWSSSGYGNLLGDIDFQHGKNAEYYRSQVEMPFFKHYLKDEGEFDQPEARMFETGTNEWRSYDQWPPPNTESRSLYLQAGEALSFSAPDNGGDDAFDEYISDPNKPVPHFSKMVTRWGYEFMHSDQRFAAWRPDVLVYKSEPLEQDVTIVGPLYAELYVSTTGTDADWVVKLIDVYPNDAPPNEEDTRMAGYQMLVRGEIMRGKFRDSFEEPEPFIPGEVAKVRFELQDVNHTFKAGHYIMVQVQSTWFPLVDRNPQTFCDIYNATKEDYQRATHRVYRSKEYPSHVEVSVLKK